MLPLSSETLPFFIVAHRGFKAHYAENTLTSFEKALEAKANMIELDVRMTKDQVLVVLHDTTMLRLGNRRRHVSALLWEELQLINLHDKEARHLKSGSVLMLERLFKALGDKIYYYIEIKTSKSHGKAYKERHARHVIALTEEYGLLDQAFFVTFDYPLLEYIYSYRSDLYLGLNYFEPLTDKQLVKLSKMRARLCPDRALLHSSEDVRKLKREGFKVMPWVVNDPLEMEKLIAWGVDGITSDDPATLARTVRTNLFY